jgi:hypothetical protein
MTKTLLSYDVGNRPPRPQPPPSFEAQLKALSPDVRSVADSLSIAIYGNRP